MTNELKGLLFFCFTVSNIGFFIGSAVFFNHPFKPIIDIFKRK